MKQRLLSFGNSTITLQYGDGRPAELVHLLFDHIPETQTGQPWTRFHLDVGDGDDGWMLRRDDSLIYQNPLAGRMADHLMGQVCYTLAHESREGLLVHAAGVSDAGKGIILPGKSGAGKSTLTAWLVANGCAYSTDEMVFIPTGGEAFSGFTRPIAIKVPARHLLPSLVKQQSDREVAIHSPVEMLPPETLGAAIVEGAAPLNLFVFPAYQEERPVELTPLSKAQTTYELMKCLANARNLDQHGLPEAIRLAKTTPAYALTFSDLDQAGRTIIRLLRNESGDPPT
jgi:hypothetical protein